MDSMHFKYLWDLTYRRTGAMRVNAEMCMHWIRVKHFCLLD